MRHHPKRRALSFEPLEGRDCPAGQISVFFGIMTVTGDAGANVATITDTGNGTVTATIDGITKTASGVRAVIVNTGAGNDTIDYAITGTQTGSRVATVNAGGGDDTIALTTGSVNGAFGFAAFGGGGADQLTATVGGIAGGGALGVALDGGAGDDTLTATAAGEVDGLFTLGLTGAAGNDDVSGSVDVTAGSTGYMLVGVEGGFGDDTLALSATGNGLAGLKRLVLVLDGGPGTDTATTTSNVTVYNVP